MIRTLRSVPLAVLLVAALLAVPAPSSSSPAPQAGERLLSYGQVFAGGDGEPVTGSLPSIEGWLDADRYLEEREDPADGERKIFAVAAADGAAEVYLDPAALQEALPDGFDARRPAAVTDDRTGFVYERDDDLYHLDRETGRLKRLTATPQPENNPRFSPDGDWIAYTRGRDLYAYDLVDSVEHRYTTDGSDVVYNGWASWVYMEEILGRGSRYAAFWWSPDSTRLAFMRFDDTPVPEFPIYHADGQHGDLEVERYPKPGDPNPWVRMGVVPVDGGDVVWMDFEEKADHYIAWPFWTPDGSSLTVQWMNRDQDTIRFYDCDPETGEKRQIFEERQDSWVEWFEDIHYLSDGTFLLRSNADGWSHLYHHAADGRLLTRLTSGDWRVSSIEEVDEEDGAVWFVGRPGPSWDAQLMRVNLDGTGLTEITDLPGVHSPRVAPGGDWFIDTVSTVARPPRMTLHRGDGTEVRELGDARTEAVEQYAWGDVELFTIPSEDGRYQLPAYWVLPPDLDESRRYPVIFSIYGGPNAGRVHNRWLGLQPHYWAQRGVITVSVDHRASGHFGKAGVSLMHRNLGKWEMTDLTTAARWLHQQPFVDGERIGITGGSYGGYTTLMALTQAAGTFDFGVARSSVTSWELYDTVYTERYMDSPEENPEGYGQGSVLSWIDRYVDGTLLITHGTIDDNVHMQNSIQVIDWLTSHDRRFEMMIYPDSRHGFQAAQRPHADRETHDFWVRKLLGGRLPETTEAGRR